MALAEELSGRLGGGVDVLTGTIDSVIAGTSVTVQLSGNLIPALLITEAGYNPVAGDAVLVLRQRQRVWVLGPITPPMPPTGTVTASTGSTVTVTVTGIGSVTLPFVTSYTPAVSDVVAILWSGGRNAGVVLGKIGSGGGGGVAPPAVPATPGATSGQTTFTAVDVGTYRSGWRSDDNGDVIQGTYSGFPGANEGAWFYGGFPHSTLGGATITGADIWLGRTSAGVYGSQNIHLYRVADDTQPAGALTFGSGPWDLGLAVGQSGWFPFSVSIAQEIVTNGGSIGCKGSPYMRMFGLSKSGQAGALRVSWRR